MPSALIENSSNKLEPSNPTDWAAVVITSPSPLKRVISYTLSSFLTISYERIESTLSPVNSNVRPSTSPIGFSEE